MSGEVNANLRVYTLKACMNLVHSPVDARHKEEAYLPPMKQAFSPEVQGVLERSSAEGNLIKLPGQLDPKLYKKVNDALNGVGAKWNRKLGGHLCDEALGDTEELLNVIRGGGNLVKDLQFYQTPVALAARLVDYAVHYCAVPASEAVALEPSAGCGRIVHPLCHTFSQVHAVEVHEPFIERLAADEVYNVDFLAWIAPRLFDVIVMNPPFSNGQEVQHVLKARECLKDDGVCIAVVSAAFGVNERGLYKEVFGKTWWRELAMLSRETFKESGVNVATKIILVKR